MKNNYRNIVGFILGIMSYWCLGQSDTSKRKVLISGNAGSQLELYSLNANDTNMQQRRMPFNYRLFINPTIKFGDKFSLPFSFSISQRQATALYPQIPAEKPIDYLINPYNNVGLHPKFKWGEFHVGTHTPSYSDLSIGNVPLFGLGFDINPGIIRLAASTGLTSWGTIPDPVLGIRPVYQRKVISAKVGVGKKDKSGIYFNLLKVFDDTTKTNRLPQLNPEEGVVLSTNYELKLTDKIKWTGELAGSVYTANSTMAPDSSNEILNNLSFLLSPRLGSMADFALVSKLDFNFNKFGLGLNLKHFGAGYKSLMNPFQQSDIQDLTVSPRFQFFKNKWMVNGEVGVRRNNISGTKIGQSIDKLYLLNNTIMLTKSIVLNGTYTNFGIENDAANDTLKVKFISENFNINVNYRFKISSLKNTLMLGYNQSVFEDLNVVSGVNNNNYSRMFLIAYSVLKKKMKVGISGSKVFNNQLLRQLEILNTSINLSYKLEKQKLTFSGRLNYNITDIDAVTKTNQLTLRPSIKWEVKKKTTLNIGGSINSFTNKQNSLRDFTETLASFGIITSF
jgi:hypothetical protein